MPETSSSPAYRQYISRKEVRKTADKIQVKRESAEADAVRIESAAACLAAAPLDSQDMRTTIPANASSKAAYQRFQERIASLGTMLDQEVNNIRSLNVAFTEFDEMMGRLTADGGRGSVISVRGRK